MKSRRRLINREERRTRDDLITAEEEGKRVLGMLLLCQEEALMSTGHIVSLINEEESQG
jgi:hypothetical protein